MTAGQSRISTGQVDSPRQGRLDQEGASSLIGDAGTGKSHLLIALGIEAAMQGHRVEYTLATKLVNELVEPPTRSS